MILSRGIKMLEGGLVLRAKGRVAEWSLCWTRAASCSTAGGPPISAGPIPAPIVQLLGRFVQLSRWSREAKSEKLFHTVLPLSCF